MARRVPQQSDVEETPENTPSMPGGSPGVESETHKQTAHLAVQFKEPDPDELAKLPRPKVFRVSSAPNNGRFVTNGMPVQIRVGSRVSDATHDLASLRQQGIHLEEILDAK